MATMPLATDTLIIEAIGQGTAKAASGYATCLPVYPYGVSTHRRSFPGTFNVGGRAFDDSLDGSHGYTCRARFQPLLHAFRPRRNCSFLVNVVKYIGERYPYIFCATAWLYLMAPQGAAALQARRASPIGGMGHACELETPLILALAPGTDPLRACRGRDGISSPRPRITWIDRRRRADRQPGLGRRHPHRCAYGAAA